MRLDQHLVGDLIAPRSRVLDVGSGDGSLIDYLHKARGCDARGIEIDMQEVTRSIAHGLPVMHGDADHDLVHYADNSFDYVVLQRTLQAVEKPREVLRHMLRIGRNVIVSFPNFGHLRNRLQLSLEGRMPMNKAWNIPWHETPNIHPCTMRDFFELCHHEHYKIDRWLALNKKGQQISWCRSFRVANLLSEQALFVLRCRNSPTL